MLIENLQDRCTLKLTAEFLWNLSVSSPVDCRLTLVTFSPLLSDLSGSSDPTRQHLDHHWFIIMSLFCILLHHVSHGLSLILIEMTIWRFPKMVLPPKVTIAFNTKSWFNPIRLDDLRLPP